MESQLRAIQAGVNKAENDLRQLVDALNSIASRWGSITTAFDDCSDQLDSFARFPDLRSKMELEQLSTCDALVANIGQAILILEHAITTSRAAFVKAKQSFRSKELSEAWPFPPSATFIGELFTETDDMIESASNSLERHRLALYNLTTIKESLNPDSISSFVRSVA